MMECGTCWVEADLANKAQRRLGFPFILHSFLSFVVLFRVYVFASLLPQYDCQPVYTGHFMGFDLSIGCVRGASLPVPPDE